jgi:hypothetical protein
VEIVSLQGRPEVGPTEERRGEEKGVDESRWWYSRRKWKSEVDWRRGEEYLLECFEIILIVK